MIPVWDGASYIEYCRYHPEELYVACLFPDKVTVYKESTKEVVMWIPGTYVSIAFYRDQLYFVNSEGQDFYVDILDFGGEYIPTVSTFSFSYGMDIFIYEVNSCAIAARVGLTFTFNYKSALTAPKLSFYTNAFYYNGTTPAVWNTDVLRDKTSYFRHNALFHSNGIGTSYSYPKTFKRVAWSPPGIEELGEAFFRNWGPSYAHAIDATYFGVSYWDGTEFHTTQFLRANRKAFVVDGEYFLISYTSVYSLYKYSSSSNLFEKVTAFNPGDAALPTSHTRLVMDYAASTAIAIEGKKFYTIDLTDGSYTVIDQPDSSRNIGYMSKTISDPGVGKDKLYYYSKWPYTHVRVFNITQQTFYSKDVTAVFSGYVDDINDLLTGGDYVIGGVRAAGVEPFSAGICVFTLVYTYYDSQYELGMGRLTIDPGTGDFTILDTDLDFLFEGGSLVYQAPKLTYSRPLGPGKYMQYYRIFAALDFEKSPPYFGTGPTEVPDTTYYVTVPDPNDWENISIISMLNTSSDVYVLSNFTEGDCLIFPDEVIDSVGLREYTIFAVIKDGVHWLLSFSSEFDWGNNSKLSRRGVLDKSLLVDLDAGESLTILDYFIPYAERQSEPILSLNPLGEAAIAVEYVSGKSVVFSIGELLE